MDESVLAEKATILVVDDAPDNLSFLRSVLKDDFKVKVATGGERALVIATSDAPPDLILLDIVMPEMDGYEVCRRLKAHPTARHIPVIFLTARTAERDEQTGLELGAVDYISKPISPAIVLARVKSQLSLKQVRDELERRNLEDKQKFELAMAQQMELNAMKSTFVSMTSHEFRTPLTIILSSQELLRSFSDRMSAEERNVIFDDIKLAVRRMVTMLDQVLTLGRADAHLLEFEPQPMDLTALCLQLREEALAGHPAPNGDADERLTLSTDFGHDMVYADEKLLRYILGNLLSNAIKYTPSGAAASFRVSRDQTGLVFEVVDQGIGIPAHELPRLFSNFHRATNVGDIPGTGLGLAIVKRSVERHGGTIDVQSELGVGTRFTVRIAQPEPGSR